MREGESCLYLIMMTHWFRSVRHNLSGKGKPFDMLRTSFRFPCASIKFLLFVAFKHAAPLI